MKRYMLETNTVSYIIKAKSQAARGRLAGLRQDETVCISAITEAELHFGLEKIGNPRAPREALHVFLRMLPVLDWGRTEAAVYGELRATQQARGKPLGNLDMLIAAHALAMNAVLVTNDRAFEHIAGLRITNWATDLTGASSS